MKLHPEDLWILDHFSKVLTPYHELNPVDARTQYDTRVAELNVPKAEVGQVEDRTITGWKGPITIRIYRPQAGEADGLPITLFAHGGGFVIGSLDSHDPQCREICKQANTVVVAVGYTKAPEGKFPIMQEDCYRALCWVSENAGDIGGDPSRIGVCGDSAGGVISACLPQLSRERNGPRICFQALVYPGIDRFTPVPSHTLFKAGKFLTKELSDWYRSLYWPEGDAYSPKDIRLSPGQQRDLSGLPPALIVTVGADPLRDEGLRYAQLLSEAGVDVTYVCHWGHLHGCWVWSGKVAAGRRITRDVASALREAFHGT